MSSEIMPGHQKQISVKDTKLKTCSNSQVYIVILGCPNNLLAFLFYLQT